jgi:hypothetical protein
MSTITWGHSCYFCNRQITRGKPTTSDTYSFTLKVTDSMDNTATQSLTIKVN